MEVRSPASDDFEKLLNFRDVAESVNHASGRDQLKLGQIFRSARPDDMTPADRNKLLHTYNIKTIIDLRTTTEHIEAAKAISASASIPESAATPYLNDRATSLLRIPGIKHLEINLNGKGFERSLLWQLSYASLAKVIGLMVFGYRLSAISIMAREVLQPRGLIGLGIDTLEHSQPEMKQMIEVLADEQQWPVMIHCTQGKDRTGLVVVVLLLLCSIDIDAITQDYVKSEQELEPDKERRMKEITSIGLDESFARCPEEFPSEILKHITTKYKSVDGYCEHIGVLPAQLDQIRQILLCR